MIGRWMKLGGVAALVAAGCSLPGNQSSAFSILSQQYSSLSRSSGSSSSASMPPAAPRPESIDGPTNPNAGAPLEMLEFTPAPGTTVPLDEVPQFAVDPSWPKSLPQGWNWWRTPGDTTRAGQGSDVLGIRADKNDHVWVTNRASIAEYDPSGTLLQVWNADRPHGPTGRQYNTIHGMFIDNDGYIWTTGRESHVVLKFSPNGKLAQVFGVWGETGGSDDRKRMGRPAEVWVDTVTKELFIADGYTNHRLLVLDGLTGEYLRHWGADGLAPCDARAAGGGGGGGGGGRAAGGAAGAAGGRAAGGAGAAAGGAGGRAAAPAAGAAPAGGRAAATAAGAAPAAPRVAGVTTPDPTGACPALQYSTPHGIVGSRDGLIYISDRQNSRVQVFDHIGNFKGTVQTREGTGGAFSIELSPDAGQRWIYVADGTGHRVWIIQRSDLQVVGSFSQAGHERGQVGRPHNLAIDSKGNLYVSEGQPNFDNDNAAGQRAQKFTMVSPE